MLTVKTLSCVLVFAMLLMVGGLTKSVHTRLGHSDSDAEPALMEPPRSACTNVLWFDLVVLVAKRPPSPQPR
jgi:hypothetical protein